MKETDPEGETLESVMADLREALQHRDAALEHRDELEKDLRALVTRAERLLMRARSKADGEPGAGVGDAPARELLDAERGER